MNNIIEQILQKYNINNTNDKINALKEIIQEVILSGLSRGDFFDEAAFYGGTALRIFYNLDRFSEDLDFALLKPNKEFDFSKYFTYIEKELLAYGLCLEVTIKEKSTNSNISTAFVKGDTLEQILKFFPTNDNHEYNQLLKNIKIKLEVDINPPEGAAYKDEYKLLPSPHKIKLYDEKSLFAGKIHAILCRNWKTRTKGRDLYDYIFFIAHNTKINLELLKNKLIASNYINNKSKFDLDILKKLLIEKFNNIDFIEAKEDVIPFINDSNVLELWNKEFFIDITNKIN